MGLLDSVLGGLMGGQGGGNNSGMQGVLMNLLGGGQQRAGMEQGMGGQPVAGQPIAGQGAGGGLMGGLGGLLSQFQNAGLGHVAQSWVGTGSNEPVSPQQLQGVFGEDRVQQMAGQAGMPKHDFLSQLSQHLPQAVDGMTPPGKLPDEGTVSV